MNYSANKIVLCQKWPELDAQMLAEFYEEIKLNKKLKIDWINPGRIDPNLVVGTSSNAQSSTHSAKENENIDFIKNVPMEEENNKNLTAQLLSEFDEYEAEENVIKEIFKFESAELISHKMRRGSNATKIASFEKIFNDMIKSYETNNQQFNEHHEEDNQSNDQGDLI